MTERRLTPPPAGEGCLVTTKNIVSSARRKVGVTLAQVNYDMAMRFSSQAQKSGDALSTEFLERGALEIRQRSIKQFNYDPFTKYSERQKRKQKKRN